MKSNVMAARIAVVVLLLAPGRNWAEATAAQAATAAEAVTSAQYGRTGVHVEEGQTPGSYLVTYVAPTSPADQAGIKPGDGVVAVDDIPAAKMTYRDVLHFLNGRVGGFVMLTLRRDGEPDRRVTLTRQPYLDVYLPAAKAGDAEAAYMVGYYYQVYSSEPGDFPRGTLWMQKAAKGGVAKAQTDLGYQYVWGNGVPQDARTGACWYLKAAKQDDAKAEQLLAEMYHWGNGVPQSDSDAYKWDYRAAQQGNAEAECALAYAYHTGRGVEQDDDRAFAWYYRAAQQDNVKAEYAVGYDYQLGRGAPQNDKAAFAWLYRAAQQDDPEAEGALAYAYESGRGVAPDNHAAFAWFYRSAEQGNAWGAWGLSDLYERGRGVPRDLAQADHWIRVAHDKMPDNAELTRATVMLGLVAFVETRDVGSVDLALVPSAFHREILIAFLALLFIYLAIGIWLLATGLMAKTYPPPLTRVLGWGIFFIESQFVAISAVLLFGRTLSADLVMVALVVLGVVPLVISSLGRTRRLIWRRPTLDWKKVLLSGAGAYVVLALVVAGYHYFVACVTGGSLPVQPTLALIGRTEDASMWVAYTSIALAFPVAEEILFRGYFFDALRRRFSGRFTVVTTAFVFAIYHCQLDFILPLFCFGLALGWLKTRTDSILPGIVLHILNNALAMVLAV